MITPTRSPQMPKGFTLYIDRGLLSCGVVDGSSVMVARWPMAVAMQTISDQSNVELELESSIGQATIFTSADQMLLVMTDRMRFC